MWRSTMPAPRAIPARSTEQTPESYAAVFDTNVLGTLLGMKHEMRVMAPQGGGSIVNLSSVLGKVGRAGRCGLYGEQARRRRSDQGCGARRAASGVRVNAVAPGPVETEMLNRFTGGGERKADFLDTYLCRAGRRRPRRLPTRSLFLACKAPFSPGGPSSSMGKTAS